jgi:hypothetical protein
METNSPVLSVQMLDKILSSDNIQAIRGWGCFWVPGRDYEQNPINSAPYRSQGHDKRRSYLALFECTSKRRMELECGAYHNSINELEGVLNTQQLAL